MTLRPLLALPACAIALAAPPASAQIPSRTGDATPLSAVEVRARDPLSEVVVNGRLRCTLPTPSGEPAPKPRVVDTWPKEGDVVAPGLLYLRVTYSERMSPCGFLLGSTLTGDYPDFLAEPARLTRDLKTFYFAVTVKPGTSYGVSFNALLVNAHFRSLHDQGAPARSLHFRTSDAPRVETRTAALTEDPGSRDLAQAYDRLLVLWAPRGDDREDAEDGDDGTPDLPLCGRCQGNVLAGPEQTPPATGGGGEAPQEP